MKPLPAVWSGKRLLQIGLVGVIVGLLATIAYFKSEPEVAPIALGQGSSQDVVDFGITRPLPLGVDLDAAQVALGARLFHEPRLSSDNTVSCATCHALGAGGMDKLARSRGVRGGVGGINAPTVFNSGLNFVQFWDGRAPTLETQIDGPIHHPLEMASNWQEVISKLAVDSAYVSSFSSVYKDGITASNIKSAIATFERSLITPNSRFDKYLQGDKTALTSAEQRGYEMFQSYGCASCHQGVNLGGNMYEKMGLMGDYFADRGDLTEADKGRFNVNKSAESMHEFRVPSLRNVALTAPYFHDGSAATLEDAVKVMVKYQLGRPMPSNDLRDVVLFLKTLTGEYQGRPL